MEVAGSVCIYKTERERGGGGGGELGQDLSGLCTPPLHEKYQIGGIFFTQQRFSQELLLHVNQEGSLYKKRKSLNLGLLDVGINSRHLLN